MVNFTFLVCPFGVYLEGDDVDDKPFPFDGDLLLILNFLLLEFLNFDTELMFDFRVELFP